MAATARALTCENQVIQHILFANKRFRWIWIDRRYRICFGSSLIPNPELLNNCFTLSTLFTQTQLYIFFRAEFCPASTLKLLSLSLPTKGPSRTVVMESL